ncbi:MAG: PLD nuclease N-terminal domain-containing protein, partial [Candidatus Omnitrophica bacterium]|nr:PLD nuclease N-terminal domain-containing protein [Candidatus Omnitrophota bacterium]
MSKLSGLVFDCLLLFPGLLWICALVSCIRRKFENKSEKMLWILVLIFGAFIGGFIYWIAKG